MPSSLFANDDETQDSNSALPSIVSVISLNRDGNRSAFTPYKPTTVLTNLQRGNVQTQTPSVPSERSIHQLAAQGELFLQNTTTLESGLDANQRDSEGLTPLMWASSYGQVETVRKLLGCGASPTLVSDSRKNALILASAAGHAVIVRDLISHGSVLDYKDQDGNTAVMYAVFNNHAVCVQELLNAGADLTIVNEALETAFDIAIKRRSKNAQAIMEKHFLNLMAHDQNLSTNI